MRQAYERWEPIRLAWGLAVPGGRATTEGGVIYQFTCFGSGRRFRLQGEEILNLGEVDMLARTVRLVMSENSARRVLFDSVIFTVEVKLP